MSYQLLFAYMSFNVSSYLPPSRVLLLHGKPPSPMLPPPRMISMHVSM